MKFIKTHSSTLFNGIDDFGQKCFIEHFNTVKLGYNKFGYNKHSVITHKYFSPKWSFTSYTKQPGYN